MNKRNILANELFLTVCKIYNIDYNSLQAKIPFFSCDKNVFIIHTPHKIIYLNN
jgi:hypothetical protein